MKNLGILLFICLICQSCIVISTGGKNKNAVGNNYEKVSGKGKVIGEVKEYSGFNKLSLFAPVKVKIVKGDTYSVNIAGHENLVSLLNIEVKNKTLKIDTEKNYEFTDDVKVLIQMPIALQKMDVGSLCQVSVGEVIDQDKFEMNATGVSRSNIEKLFVHDIDLNISGVSKVDIMSLEGKKLSLNLSGVSEAKIDGKTVDLSLEMSGVSKGFLKELEAENVDCRMSGVSDCEMRASQVLKADISGVSKLIYSGDPSKINTNASGKSMVKKISKE